MYLVFIDRVIFPTILWKSNVLQLLGVGVFQKQEREKNQNKLFRGCDVCMFNLLTTRGEKNVQSQFFIFFITKN